MGATISDAFTLYKPSADKLPSYKARQFLIKRGVPFEVQQEKPEGPLVVAVGDKTISGFDDKAYETAVTDAGYPKSGQAGERQFRRTCPDPGDSGHLRHDGLRADRRVSCRTVPDADPVYLNVVPVPHRERLVWRIPSADYRRHHGGDRKYLCRFMVSDFSGCHELSCGHTADSRD
jgi:hypothetical protein